LVYQASMIHKVSTTVGWLALVFIAYATLSPIDARPTIADIKFEHFGAFGLVGLALGLAYPKRLLWIAVIVVGSAFGLEALQLLTPDRHGRIVDAAVKAAGGICGIGISHLATIILRTKISRAG
jgi:VanZ family protein